MSQTQSQLNMGRVKLGDLKEVAKLEFLDLLDQFPGGKVLVWDPALTGPMGLIAEYSILKEHQVMNRENIMLLDVIVVMAGSQNVFSKPGQLTPSNVREYCLHNEATPRQHGRHLRLHQEGGEVGRVWCEDGVSRGVRAQQVSAL